MSSRRAFFSYFHVLLILFYVCVVRIYGHRRIHGNRDIDRYHRRIIDEEDELAIGPNCTSL